MFRTLVCVLAVIAAFSTVSSASNNKRAVVLKNGLIDTTVEAPLSQVLKDRAISFDPERHDQFMVHVEGPVTEALKARLSAALEPYRLGKYMPHNTFLVSAPADKIVELESLEGVAWTGHYSPVYRVSSGLEHEALRSADDSVNRVGLRTADHPNYVHGFEDERTVRLFVNLVPEVRPYQRTHESAAAIAALWSRDLEGYHVAASSANRIVVQVPESEVADAAERIAAQPEAHWVEGAPVMVPLNYYAAPLLQEGKNPKSYPSANNYKDNKNTPFWKAGVTGKGVSVCVGDSGVDRDHCFFSNKLEHYEAYADADDASTTLGGGHGTHVAGSVLGNGDAVGGIVGPNRGMAYEADLVVFDIGVDDPASGAFLSLDVPPDLNAQYFPVMQDNGAHISTNSWGASPVTPQGQYLGTSYNVYSEDCDRYMDDNRDFLILFAAGNDGAYAGTGGEGTIGSPSTAKNVITVGATQAPVQGTRDYCCMDPDSIYCMTAGCNQGTIDAINQDPDLYDSEHLAYFSSQGPLTDDNRIKPDLTAPGYFTWSANSNGPDTTDQCNGADDNDYFYAMAGTSMATPTAAGIAALVEQYYRDGYYPSATADDKDSITPTGSLMKATLMGGTVDMSGNVDGIGAPMGETPNTYEGWGRIDLSHSLYIEGNTPEIWGMTVFSNEDDSVSTDDSEEYCWDALEGGDEIKITLVWTDPPASPATAIALINDLDLTVELDGSTYQGNGGDDDRNNVEQVVVKKPGNGKICATVTGANVAEGPQSYSLVAQGSMVGEAGPTAKNGLSTGAIIAIVLGVIVLVGVIGGAAFFFFSQRSPSSSLAGYNPGSAGPGNYNPGSHAPSAPNSYAPTGPPSYAPPSSNNYAPNMEQPYRAPPPSRGPPTYAPNAY